MASLIDVAFITSLYYFEVIKATSIKLAITGIDLQEV